MKTALVTYLYPGAVAYVPGFCATLQQQEGTAFELLVFNDGVPDAGRLFINCPVACTIIPVSGSVTAIRHQSFRMLAEMPPANYVFQDIDDWMSPGRLAVAVEGLRDYPLVCNDLALADETGNIFCASTWSERLPDGFVFDHAFLRDKNIAGLGNSAVQKEWLRHQLVSNDAPVASDWFLFYQLLYNTGSKALFTNRCQTIYRQHGDNIAGLTSADEQRLRQVLRVCAIHYSALADAGFTFLESDLLAVRQTTALLHQSYVYQPPVAYQHLYWWEEKNYIHEKNSAR